MQDTHPPAARQAATTSGFTLIELLVVVVIIGVLVAIADPGLPELPQGRGRQVGPVRRARRDHARSSSSTPTTATRTRTDATRHEGANFAAQLAPSAPTPTVTISDGTSLKLRQRTATATYVICAEQHRRQQASTSTTAQAAARSRTVGNGASPPAPPAPDPHRSGGAGRHPRRPPPTYDERREPHHDAPLLILAGVLGLAVGSFLNVVIHRVPRGESLLRPGSHCPHCAARRPRPAQRAGAQLAAAARPVRRLPGADQRPLPAGRGRHRGAVRRRHRPVRPQPRSCRRTSTSPRSRSPWR